MTSNDLTLVVGATGILGLEIALRLRRADRRVRALVRPTAAQDRRRALLDAGVELVAGDLKDVPSLEAACRGVSTVVSTASSTVSRQAGDSIETVDHLGQLALVLAAEQAGVQHFVFVSFILLSFDCELQRAKRRVERRLHESRMAHTILQPVDFLEVWLGPALAFDPVHGKARVLGSGNAPVSWISYRDVARFAVAAVISGPSGSFSGETVILAGPDALSPLQVIAIFEELGGPKVVVERVPEEALRAQLEKAENSLQEAYAAMMLGTSRGQVADAAPALALLPGRLLTVREYAKSRLNEEESTMSTKDEKHATSGKNKIRIFIKKPAPDTPPINHPQSEDQSRNVVILGDDGSFHFISADTWAAAPVIGTGDTGYAILEELATNGTYLANLPDGGLGTGTICVLVNLQAVLK